MPSAPGYVPKYESNERFSCMMITTWRILWMPETVQAVLAPASGARQAAATISPNPAAATRRQSNEMPPSDSKLRTPQRAVNRVIVPATTADLSDRIRRETIPVPRLGGERMPKYLFRASYTAEGARGLISEGGSSRVEVAARLAEGLGGRLESYYFAFGE